jgi:hypothetical protein
LRQQRGAPLRTPDSVCRNDGSTGVLACACIVAEDLPVTKLGIELDFAKPASDAIQLRALVSVPDGYSPTGDQVTVDVGGVARSFVLDEKGKARADVLGEAGKDRLHEEVTPVRDRAGRPSDASAPAQSRPPARRLSCTRSRRAR